MPARRPWPLLLAKLRQAAPARLSYAEVLEAHADPAVLVAEGIAEYGKPQDYLPPGCEHSCLPNVDFDTRASEGLVGIACPSDPACWPGWRWVPRDEVLSLRCRSSRIFAALREENGLTPLDLPPGTAAMPIGRLRRRGLDVPVIWMRARQGFEPAARGLRLKVGGDALIIVVPQDPGVRLPASERIAVLELEAASDGNLGLIRGLDELDPGYRTKAARRHEADAEVDWIRLRFATEDRRHVLVVNDHQFVGFHQADTLFARLLLLAAARKSGRHRGWLHKASLVGDFAERPAPESLGKADRALEKLREELVADDVPGLSHQEQDAILKAGRGTGKVRLSVLPEHITFDPSLASLIWKLPATAKGKKLSGKQAGGVDTAMLLLAEARRLGVPGGAGEVPFSTATSRSGDRHSAPSNTMVQRSPMR